VGSVVVGAAVVVVGAAVVVVGAAVVVVGAAVVVVGAAVVVAPQAAASRPTLRILPNISIFRMLPPTPVCAGTIHRGQAQPAYQVLIGTLGVNT